MDRFAALVSGRRAASAAAAADVQEVEVVEEERDEAYLRIRLEEIVIVKNDAYDDALSAPAPASASAARVANGVAASSMEKRCACGDAAIDAAPAPGWGSATAAAARGAWTTVTRIVGLD